MRITEVLKHGRENATRADVLAAKLETTPRGLRSLVYEGTRRRRDPSCMRLAATAGTSYRVMTRKPHKRNGRLLPRPGRAV